MEEAVIGKKKDQVSLVFSNFGTIGIPYFLQRVLTSDDADQDHDDCNDEEDVDESAECVCSDHSKNPKNDEYDCDCE